MEKIQKTIGLIGVGNMGAAILEGVLKENLITNSHVFVYDKIIEKAALFASRCKVHRAESSEKLVKAAEIIILAVKPQDLEAANLGFSGDILKSRVIISILAGTPLAKLRIAFGPDAVLVRAMPNLGAKVGASLTALTSENAAGLSEAEKIFLACGKVLQLEEKHFDLVTALSGSGPAYFFLLMEMLAEEGMKRGLSREQARLLAVQTGVGAGLLAQSALESPAELRVMVTSKGGTTEAALKVLEEGNIRKIFSEAIAAAHRRGAELSKGA